MLRPGMPHHKPAHRLLQALPLLAILLLGFALRVYGLGAQSFWNDEGNTARLVERRLPLIIEGAGGDIHPPGYYVLLAGWRTLAGESEFALRSYSTWCGMLSIALAAALGSRLGGRWGGIVAALLVTLNPLSVYYSQEARMYAQLGLSAGLTLWTGVHLVSRRRVTLWSILALALAITFGLYTQYAYAFALVGLNLGFALYWLLSQPWRWSLVWRWALAHLIAGIAFLPWAPIALRASGWQPPDLGTEGALAALLRALVVGVTLPEGKGGIAPAVVAALTALALLTRSRRPFLKWASLGMLWAPVVLIVALGAYRPAYLKFMSVAVVPLALVAVQPLALGWAHRQRASLWIRRVAVLGLLLVLLPFQLGSLSHLYRDPAYRRDDYRGIAARIARESHPGDAILLNAPNQWEVFTYYYRGPLKVYPAPYRPTSQETEAWLSPILASYARLFVIYWGDIESDPQRWIEATLAQRAYKAGESWNGDVRIAIYGTGSLPTAPDTRLDASLGSAIRLSGSALPAARFEPGDIVPLTLFWTADAQITERYKVFVHLLDPEGALVAQTDSEPGGGFALTDRWQPGENLIDRYGVLLPAELPTGDYTLWMGMYGLSGERLPVTRDGQALGDALRGATITVK